MHNSTKFIFGQGSGQDAIYPHSLVAWNLGGKDGREDERLPRAPLPVMERTNVIRNQWDDHHLGNLNYHFSNAPAGQT